VLKSPFGPKTLYYMTEGDMIPYEQLWGYLEKVNLESNKNRIMQKFLAAEYYGKEIGEEIDPKGLGDVTEDDLY